MSKSVISVFIAAIAAFFLTLAAYAGQKTASGKNPQIPKTPGPSSIMPCALPPGARDEILKKYPHRKLLTTSDLDEYDAKFFQADHGEECPGLVSVDFYGDHKQTWAMVLISGEEAERKSELVVAHAVDEGWELRALETGGRAPAVWSDGPGKYNDIYGKKTIRASRPVIVFCGFESWTIVYAWTGKAVDKVWLTD